MEPRRSKRARTSKFFGSDFLTFLLENEPLTFKEAMFNAEASLWKECNSPKMQAVIILIELCVN